MGQRYTYYGLQFLLSRAATSKNAVQFTGTHQRGTNMITNVQFPATVFPALQVGMLLSGNYTDGKWITALNQAAQTITISSATTGSGTNTGAITAYGNYLDTFPLVVHLLLGTIPTGPDTTWAQLTEANYDGYAPQTVPQTVLTKGDPGKLYAVAETSRVVFQPQDHFVPNYITGHAFTITRTGDPGPTLIATETYPSSVPLMQSGDILTFNPALSLPYDCSAGPNAVGVY